MFVVVLCRLIVADVFQTSVTIFEKRNQKMNKFNGTGNGETAEITVTPPDSLVKYEAPLFVGIEASSAAPQGRGGLNENNTKIEDMINSILPPRSVIFFNSPPFSVPSLSSLSPFLLQRMDRRIRSLDAKCL
jgi:hypothetical protein